MTALTLITFAVQHKYATAGVAGLLALNQVHTVWRLVRPRRVKIVDHRDVFQREVRDSWNAEERGYEERIERLMRKWVRRKHGKSLADAIQLTNIKPGQWWRVTLKGVSVYCWHDDLVHASLKAEKPVLESRWLDLRAALIAAEEEAGKPQAAVCGTVNSTIGTLDWSKITADSVYGIDPKYGLIFRCSACGHSRQAGSSCPNCTKLRTAGAAVQQ